jgi:hypothetical protein
MPVLPGTRSMFGVLVKVSGVLFAFTRSKAANMASVPPAFVFAFLQEKPQHCDFNHTKELPPNPNLHGSEIGITAKTGKFETYKRALLLVAFVTLG